MKWFAAWRRTRRALRTLRRDIDLERIKNGVGDIWDIKSLSKGDCYKYSARLRGLCKEYLIVKRIGADAAVLHKLSEVR